MFACPMCNACAGSVETTTPVLRVRCFAQSHRLVATRGSRVDPPLAVRCTRAACTTAQLAAPQIEFIEVI